MKEITIILFILIILAIFAITIPVEETNYCEIYAEQELSAMRYPTDGGEREFSLNGTWVKESTLMEDCEK